MTLGGSKLEFFTVFSLWILHFELKIRRSEINLFLKLILICNYITVCTKHSVYCLTVVYSLDDIYCIFQTDTDIKQQVEEAVNSSIQDW